MPIHLRSESAAMHQRAVGERVSQGCTNTTPHAIGWVRKAVGPGGHTNTMAVVRGLGSSLKVPSVIFAELLVDMFMSGDKECYEKFKPVENQYLMMNCVWKKLGILNNSGKINFEKIRQLLLKQANKKTFDGSDLPLSEIKKQTLKLFKNCENIQENKGDSLNSKAIDCMLKETHLAS